MMGGNIGFESEKGVGSTFYFDIELLNSHYADIVDDEHADEKNDMRWLNRTVSILLVEDDVVNTAVIQTMLEQLGCNVKTAIDGVQTLKMLAENLFDIIFMDISMPVMNGYETTEKIRENECNTDNHAIIIALTAHALRYEKEKCYAAGMDDYLSKPVTKNMLKVKLNKWLN